MVRGDVTGVAVFWAGILRPRTEAKSWPGAWLPSAVSAAGSAPLPALLRVGESPIRSGFCAVSVLICNAMVMLFLLFAVGPREQSRGVFILVALLDAHFAQFFGLLLALDGRVGICAEVATVANALAVLAEIEREKRAAKAAQD